LEAAKEWAYKLRGLTPYDGLNQNFPGDFIRWRELSVTYTTPQRLAARVGAQDMHLTLAARNLKLWTRYPGVDPEDNVYSRGGASTTRMLSAISVPYGVATDELDWIGSRDARLSLEIGAISNYLNEFTDGAFPYVVEARYLGDETIKRLEVFNANGRLIDKTS